MTQETADGENVYYTVDTAAGETIADLYESTERGRVTSGHVARYSPSRVLAECEAKRRIVAMHGSYNRAFYNRATSTHESAGLACKFCRSDDDDVVPWPCDHLRLLALPYADHQDYDEGWRV